MFWASLSSIIFSILYGILINLNNPTFVASVPFHLNIDRIPQIGLNVPSSQLNERSVYDPGAVQKQTNEIPMDLSNSIIDSSDESNWNSIENGDFNQEDELTSDQFDENSFSLEKLKNEIQEDEEIAAKSEILLKLLEGYGGTLPIVYVENKPENTDVEEINQSLDKRSGRYYRRYPWKRQNTRHRTYDAESRYLCVPSREDVMKLLLGLHDNRNGNHHRTVNFCNRKRPAKAIFTNIRFLG